MHTILFDKNDSLSAIIKKITEVDSEEVGFPLSSANPVTVNYLNLKLIEKIASKNSKKVKFIPTDQLAKEITENLVKAETVVPLEDSFGFVIGKDISKDLTVSPKINLQKKFRLTFPKIKVALPKIKGFGWILPVLFGVVVLAAVAAYALLSLIPGATVTIDLENESFTRVIELTASESASSIDVARKVLPAVKIISETEGNGTGEGTGKKEVGENAQGTMRVYNKTGSPISLRKGVFFRRITVEPGKDLQFLLAADIEVPQREATSSPQPGYVFGQAEGAIAAEKIGNEYNLSSGSTFSVGGYATTDLTAQNENDFTGGSRRTVRIVTADDQKKVYELLLSDLTERIRSDIRSRLQPEQKLDDSAVKIEVTEKSFDKKLNEEAEKFNVSLSVRGSGYAYSQNNVDELLSKVINELLPPGFEYTSSEKTTSISDVKVLNISSGGKSDTVIKLTAKVKGYIAPKLDKEKLKVEIAGKSIDDARRYVESLKGVTGVRIELLPNLPFVNNLPRSIGRLKIESIVK